MDQNVKNPKFQSLYAKLVGVNISVIMCILVWIRVHVRVAPPNRCGCVADGGDAVAAF